MVDCLFCKVLRGEFGTKFVYDDEFCKVFYDIHPKAHTHLLIVPLQHIPSVLDSDKKDSELLGHLILVSKKVSEDLGLSGYTLKINVGKDGGQEIFHIHIHLMSKS